MHLGSREPLSCSSPFGPYSGWNQESCSLPSVDDRRTRASELRRQDNIREYMLVIAGGALTGVEKYRYHRKDDWPDVTEDDSKARVEFIWTAP